ncbi:RNA binding protein [Madurella fahalii]|uniref:RNA binding protein n=1 Tax=Madurella fahalii TaxID=1157608 RepID=A0ABQ0G1T3_9PEZI
MLPLAQAMGLMLYLKIVHIMLWLLGVVKGVTVATTWVFLMALMDFLRQRRSVVKPPTLNLTAEAAGLPEDATERDILYGLDYVTRDRHFSTDQVRIARLRYDHNGRRIAVVEFHRRSDAGYFLDRYYPDISFRLEHSRGMDSEPITVGVSSPTDRDEVGPSRPRRDDDGWDCIKCGVVNYPHRAVCFKCKAERPDDDGHGASGPLLTGETDECPQQTPSQYVVVRDLEGSVTEEVLAKGIMKLFIENREPAKDVPTTTNKLKSTAPTNSTVGLGAKPGSLRRVFLMRDRRTNDSWRYGFAEFATVEDAKAAVAKFRAFPKFTIASKPVAVGFIHTGVFVPALDAASTENPEFSFTPIYNPAVRIRYWDDRAYPSVHVVAVDPISATPSPDKPASSDDASKTGARPSKKVKKDKEPVVGSKIAMMPQMQLWAKASAQLHGAKPTADTDVQPVVERPEPLDVAAAGTPHETEASQPDGPVAAQWGDQYLSYADWEKMTCLVCGWETPTEATIKERGWPQTRGDLLIEHEGRAHNLYKDAEVKEKAAAALAALRKEPRAVVRRTPRLKSEALPVYKSYADYDALRCVLCKRKFKEVKVIWLHEQQSELHKRMLADPANRQRAVEEFKAMGKKMYILEPDPEFKKAWEMQRKGVIKPAASQYRDRAQERRHAFRQPKQPSANPAAAGVAVTVPEKRKEPSTGAGTAEPEDNPAAKKAKSSKGAGMLAKMGWTAGGGLGAEGAGRTEAIAAEVYVPGVGLGAEGGKLGDAGEEAARNTRGGFTGFVEKTKERARERFEKME